MRKLSSAVLIVACLALPACGSSQAGGGSRYAGEKLEQGLQAGWDQYRFQDEAIMAKQLAAAIGHEPTLTQVGAIEAAFEYAQGLTFKQRLRPGDENRLIDQMERDFPATKAILDKEVAHS